MNDKDFDDLLGLPSEEPPQELTIVEKLKDKINKTTGQKVANIAAIKELYSRGVTDVKEICRILELKEQCVYEHLKYIRESSLGDPTTISKACKALHYQLDTVKSLDAVKMVYNHVNADQVQHNQNRGQTVININFDGLNNPKGGKIVSGKAAVYEDAVVIEATD